nr:hypothetical protein [Morchella crassipes]
MLRWTFYSLYLRRERPPPLIPPLSPHRPSLSLNIFFLIFIYVIIITKNMREREGGTWREGGDESLPSLHIDPPSLLIFFCLFLFMLLLLQKNMREREGGPGERGGGWGGEMQGGALRAPPSLRRSLVVITGHCHHVQCPRAGLLVIPPHFPCKMTLYISLVHMVASYVAPLMTLIYFGITYLTWRQ